MKSKVKQVGRTQVVPKSYRVQQQKQQKAQQKVDLRNLRGANAQLVLREEDND